MVSVLAQFQYDINFHPPVTKNPPEMTSEHQVALAESGQSTPYARYLKPSRAARQVVPAFLQKIYGLRTLF
jgi:hypothetical protein